MSFTAVHSLPPPTHALAGTRDAGSQPITAFELGHMLADGGVGVASLLPFAFWSAILGHVPAPQELVLALALLVDLFVWAFLPRFKTVLRSLNVFCANRATYSSVDRIVLLHLCLVKDEPAMNVRDEKEVETGQRRYAIKCTSREPSERP